MTRRRSSPDEVRRIVGYALEHVPCDGCDAAPGAECTRPGPGRSVCKARFVAAAIQMKQTLKAAARALEQQVNLASLPKIPKAELEKCRTPRGGYSFTKAWFLEHGLPYPPVAGWRAAVEREDGADER